MTDAVSFTDSTIATGLAKFGKAEAINAVDAMSGRRWPEQPMEEAAKAASHTKPSRRFSGCAGFGLAGCYFAIDIG